MIIGGFSSGNIVDLCLERSLLLSQKEWIVEDRETIWECGPAAQMTDYSGMHQL